MLPALSLRCLGLRQFSQQRGAHLRRGRELGIPRSEHAPVLAHRAARVAQLERHVGRRDGGGGPGARLRGGLEEGGARRREVAAAVVRVPGVHQLPRLAQPARLLPRLLLRLCAAHARARAHARVR
eukprot:scaffold65059_cov65-Phaeocystis_antarctica.AAC.1